MNCIDTGDKIYAFADNYLFEFSLFIYIQAYSDFHFYAAVVLNDDISYLSHNSLLIIFKFQIFIIKIL